MFLDDQLNKKVKLNIYLVITIVLSAVMYFLWISAK